MCQDIAFSLYERIGRVANIVDFSNDFDLDFHDQLLTKLAVSGVESRVVVWVRECLVGRTQRVRVGGQISKEVKINSLCRKGKFVAHYCFWCT